MSRVVSNVSIPLACVQSLQIEINLNARKQNKRGEIGKRAREERKRRNKQKKERKYISKPLVILVDWLLLGHSFSSWPGYFLSLHLHLLVLILQFRHRWRHNCLIRSFWTCAFILFQQAYMSAIHALFSKKDNSPTFSSWIWFLYCMPQSLCFVPENSGFLFTLRYYQRILVTFLSKLPDRQNKVRRHTLLP